jgi:uncharacterized membrane protein
MTANPTHPGRFARLAFPVLATLGLAVSLYLWYVHASGSEALCVGVGGCETVNASRYAELAGVPVAAWGAVTYLSLLLMWLLRPRVSELMAARLVLAIFGVTLVGVLFSAYLTYLELFVIHAICPWCVSSAIIITALFLVAAQEIRGLMTAG